jgi:hypothetical protein
VYGVVFADDLSVDEEATTSLRSELQEHGALDEAPEVAYPKREPSFTPVGGAA